MTAKSAPETIYFAYPANRWGDVSKPVLERLRAKGFDPPHHSLDLNWAVIWVPGENAEAQSIIRNLLKELKIRFREGTEQHLRDTVGLQANLV